MTEPTTHALIERLTQTNQFHENADVTTAEVVAKLEAQARMLDSLNVYFGQAERQRDDAIAERDNLLERLAASQKEGLELRAELAAIRAQEALNRNDPLSAFSIRFLVAAGHVTQEKADQAFSLACDAMEAEARKANIELPWVVRAPVVDVNAGLVEALEGYMDAVETMNAAMKDGVNVHGAISGLIGATDNAEEALSTARTQQAQKGGV